MNISLIVLMIIILLIGMVLKFLSSGSREAVEDQGTPVKLDFIIFNSDGLKCKDGQVLNCNLIIHGFSNETFSRELIHEEYIKVLQKVALDKDPDWFFSERAKCEQVFEEEFKKMLLPIHFASLEIYELSYADKCFTDKGLSSDHNEQQKAHYRKEVEEKEADLDRERDLIEQKFKDERDAAIKKVEEETAAAIAKVEQENRVLQEKLEKEYLDALKREEELNKENN